MMRIGINTIALDLNGGGHTFIINLLESLAKNDRLNEYYIFTNRENKDSLRMKLSNFTFVDSNMSQHNLPGRFFYEQFVIPVKAGMLGLDIYYSPTDILPLFLNGTKSVITFQNNLFYVFPYSNYIKGLRSLYFKAFIPSSLRKAIRIIAVSNSAKRDLIDYNPSLADKIKVIYEGVSDDFYPEREDDAFKWERIRRSYGIENKYILFVSTLRFFKNADKVIEAYKSLDVKEIIKPQLIIIGTPAEKEYVESLHIKVKEASLREKAIFIDSVDKQTLRLFYIHASVLTYLSSLETFGLPPLEAMACGCPVITSNRMAMPEIAGDAALIVDPENTQELAEAVSKILNSEDLRQTLIQKGYERIKQFNWEETARQTLKVFEEVCSRERE